MVNEILTAAGFVDGKTYKESRFIRPPRQTFIVFNDSFESRGTDDFNKIREHDISLEMYQYAPDSNAERRIENELDIRGIEYQKQSRYWIESEQLYQVIYEFSYIEK